MYRQTQPHAFNKLLITTIKASCSTQNNYIVLDNVDLCDKLTDTLNSTLIYLSINDK